MTDLPTFDIPTNHNWHVIEVRNGDRKESFVVAHKLIIGDANASKDQKTETSPE